MLECQTQTTSKSEKSDPFVVIGIPAFNEEKTIGRVVLQALSHADRVVVCDDGSDDLTADIAEGLGAVIVRHENNMGYGAAIRSLFRTAIDLDADILVTLDADGQHDPADVPALIKPIVFDNVDMVVGSRLISDSKAASMPWHRRAGVKFITRLTNGHSKEKGVKDGQSGLRAYGRRAMENLTTFENGMGVSAEILISARKKGLGIREIPCSCVYNNGVRTSTQNPIRHGVDVVASIARLVVEDKPLAILGVPGVLCLIVGVFFGIWMLQVYAVDRLIVTNIALASIGFLLIGFFLLSTATTLYAIKRLAQKINGSK